MFSTQSRPHSWRRARVAALIVAAIGALAPRVTHAHFRLTAPACYSQQDTLGNPQKSGPCGQADPGQPLRPTGAVTAYVEGGMITVTLTETITHPGHYRVSIAQDLASLPDDPPVTAGSSECGSTVIEANPTLPLLADGLLVHTAALSGPQTIQIPLPAGFTCVNCVLQVSEFMSQHALNDPGGCFYHHCATVSVMPAGADGGAPDGSTSADGGTTSDVAVSADARSTADGGPTPVGASGCSCSVPAGTRSAGSFAGLAGALGLALFAGRRRRR